MTIFALFEQIILRTVSRLASENTLWRVYQFRHTRTEYVYNIGARHMLCFETKIKRGFAGDVDII